jgi:hypothetical protein
LRHLRVKDPIKKKAQPSRSIYTTKLWKNKRKTHCEHSASGYVPSIAFDVRPIRSDEEEACIKELSIVEQPTRINMGDFLYMCSVAIHTDPFIIRGGNFLSTDETHKAFVLFGVYLDIRRCFLYPKALRPQNYTAGLSYTWQFQAPFQLHVIHEHFARSQTLSSIT